MKTLTVSRLSQFCLVLITIGLFYPHPSSADEVLKTRVNQLYLGWQKENPKQMWPLLSPDVRREMKYEDYSAKLTAFFEDTKLVSFNVQRLPMKKGVAIVETLVEIYIKSEGKSLGRIDKTRWALNEGDKKWYLEGGPQIGQPTTVKHE